MGLSLKKAIELSAPGDTIHVKKGVYKEGNIRIGKTLVLIGHDFPVLDGNHQSEVVSIHANNVIFRGFHIQHSSYASLNDPGGIKVYESRGVVIENNRLSDNFFGIYIQYSSHCIIRNNIVRNLPKPEQQSGNGIHCWKSSFLTITGNDLRGNRDGIYFEFVTHSGIERNVSIGNIRYGLHFMFSNNDYYRNNRFEANGAGVAVMYSKKVEMQGNHFSKNWGDASYGLLLKDISDGFIKHNVFERNTIAIKMEGANRMEVSHNQFLRNGWGVLIQASCMDNKLISNNFKGNTFDLSTNGEVMLNEVAGNYWDKYEGYDLNKDGIGDVAYHPLSLFSMITAQCQPAMLLFQSFMMRLLEQSERLIPSITPELLQDKSPKMKPLPK